MIGNPKKHSRSFLLLFTACFFLFTSGWALAAEQETFVDEFVENFSQLEPIYFIAGSSPANAKFQFSFKYRLFGSGETRAPEWSWLNGFHLGYTQTSFWDLAAPSSPFRDSSFRPALIYEFGLRKFSQVPGEPVSYVRIAAEHESNGKDGLNTRSLNTLYVEPNIVFGVGDAWHIVLNARAWVYGRSVKDNPDIQDFRGNARVGIGVVQTYGLGLAAHVGGNPGTGKGNVQVDVTYALSDLIGLDLYLTGQMYTGYGESLLNYNRKDTRVRFGFSIIR